LRPIPTQRPDGREVMRRLHVEQEHAAPQVATFVGRQPELEKLRRAFADSRRKPVALLVHGESGIGKSMLLRHFAGELEPAGAVVLAGRCYERESVPYKALDEVIDALSHRLARLPHEEAAALLPARAHLLVQAFPVLRPVVSDAGVLDVSDQQQRRALLFASLRELLCRLAARHPLVVMID